MAAPAAPALGPLGHASAGAAASTAAMLLTYPWAQGLRWLTPSSNPVSHR